MQRIAIIGGVVVIAGIAAAAYGSLSSRGGEGSAYRTAKIEQGSIVRSVSASGKLNAVVTVKVGSQISGRVSQLLADFNSDVRADQVIARIDPVSFESKVAEAKADLDVARAQVESRRAAIAQARANVANARATIAAMEADIAKAQISVKDLELDLNRKRELRASGAVAISVIDKAEAAWKTSIAQLGAARAQLSAQQSQVAAREAALNMAEADVSHGEALVEQKAAALNTARVSLDNTFIRSPVDGVVIGRDVDVGTVVAASLSSPTLFTIAQDLRSMQVEASIDEADIGQIHPGQRAVFTVDSFLGREFRGEVVQVRKQPLEAQNVITYTVVVSADNPDLRLLPGMTANVEIRVSDRANVLKVPNAALRFRPPNEDASSAAMPAPAQAAEAQPARDPEARQAQFERFAVALQLDDEQKAKLREINAETLQQARARRDAAKAARAEGADAGPAQAPSGTASAMRAAGDQKIMAMLRPDQQEKFRALIAARRENPTAQARVYVLENGAPKAVPITIGVSDASHAELVRGPLSAGAEIITGINRAAQSGGGAQSPRRFGF